NRDADAVQASGDLVAPAVAELAAGVEGGEDYLRGRLVLRLLHLVDGDAAAVVDDRAAVVRVQGDGHLLGVPRDRLVDRVVDDLVDEVVQPAWPGRADVHAGPPANGLEPLEDGDVLAAVGGSPPGAVARGLGGTLARRLRVRALRGALRLA